MNINPSPPINAKTPNVNWKKVDWKETEVKLKEMEIEDGGWRSLKGIIKKLPRVKTGKTNTKCWTEELE